MKKLGGSRQPSSTFFASFDVETDGNNPIQHSLRALGIALFCEHSHNVIDRFYVTIEPQEGRYAEQKCVENFWKKNQQAWEEVNRNCVPIETAMERLADWLRGYCSHQIKWVASPSNFDWMFLKCCYETYGPENRPDIGFHCHDLDSLLRCYTLTQGIQSRKHLVSSLSGGLPYTHHALEDALYQGRVYMGLRRLIMHAKYRSQKTNASEVACP